MGATTFQAGDHVPRKGRARRFREARELKQGYDDGLFEEGSGTLADLDDDTDDRDAPDDWDETDEEARDADEGYDWDPDRDR